MRIAFLMPARSASGLDRVAGVSLRVLGVVGLAALATGLLFVGVGVWTLLQIQLRGDQGWDGLVAGVTLMLGGLATVSGVAATWSAQRGFVAWHDGFAGPVRVVGIVWTIIGATFWMPRAWQNHPNPLDDYLALARLAVLILGLLIWAGAGRMAPQSAS